MCYINRRSEWRTEAVIIIIIIIMEAVCTDSTDHNTGLETTITVLRGTGGLGMSVSALKDGLGVAVRSVVGGGAVSEDGRLKVGDGILAINGEPTANLTNAQARATLRKHSLTGPELRVTYVPGGFLDAYRTLRSRQGQHKTDTADTAETATLKREVADGGGGTVKSWSLAQLEEQRVAPNGQPSLHDRSQEDGDQPKRVTLIKTGGESFGIGVIGGRGIGHRLSNGEISRGVFIKHVAKDGPVARADSLRPGDRILQVGGVDVSDFTHEEAVEAIRRAGDKVELLVQTPQKCEDQNRIQESSSKRYVPTPFKLSGNCLLKPPPHPVSLPLGRPSGLVSSLPDGATTRNPYEGRPPETRQLGKQGQVSYLSRVLQKYGGLPGELKVVELDCGAHTCGLGLRVTEGKDGRTAAYVSEIMPDGAATADGQIRVGDELLEINGQVLYDRSHRDVSALIDEASSRVKIVLIRNKTAWKQVLTGSVVEADGCPVTSRSGGEKHGSVLNQEGASRLETAQTSPKPHVSDMSCSGLPRSSCCPSCSSRPDPRTCPVIHGCVNTIDICKGPSSLGLTIVGGCNTLQGAIVIHELNEGGVAQRDGRLMPGDHILEVNGIDLTTATHEEALSVLRLSAQCVRLSVYRPPWTNASHDRTPAVHEDMWDLFTVELHLHAGQELGLSIVGKRDDNGVFVSEIVAGGAAGADGRLTLGDQILSVNGEDVRAASLDYARTLLQNCGSSVMLEVARFRATPRYLCEFQRAATEDGASAI
ncbi:multiple PDZ domain protein [Trichomycterus rosablanca]|uniref:multiple PDZ domain protein n=1 Tax=Trichomycterus rosablanca TaxID=2290929 RepID=UPI002F360E20